MKEETPVEIRPRHIDVLVQSRIGIAVLLFIICRSTTVPYIPGISDDDGTRAARKEGDPDGKTVQVPAELSYEEWYNKYVKNHETDALNGLVTSNGIPITSFSKHQQERADLRKVDIEGIKDALLNPLHIGDVREGENSKSQRFIGERATVNINPETGIVITSWRTGTRFVKKYKKEG